MEFHWVVKTGEMKDLSKASLLELKMDLRRELMLGFPMDKKRDWNLVMMMAEMMVNSMVSRKVVVMVLM